MWKFDPYAVLASQTAATFATLRQTDGARGEMSQKSQVSQGSGRDDRNPPAANVAKVANVARGGGRRREWTVTLPDGAALSVTCCPPETREVVEAEYPGATVEAVDVDTREVVVDPIALEAVQQWCRAVGEDDPQTITELAERASGDHIAVEWYRGQTTAVVETTADDRVTCSRCRHLRGDRCRVTGSPWGSVRWPVTDLPRRCDGFHPSREGVAP